MKNKVVLEKNPYSSTHCVNKTLATSIH